MKAVVHKTAKPSDYNKESAGYDAFNEARSALINYTTEQILKKYNVRTALDLTCGTGSQVFWLTQQGFQVIGVDINSQMLAIAKQKAARENLTIQFLKGDMRSAHIGEFDAVITIFNSIGHLTKADFELALRNIHQNLKKDGLYIFDIANLDYYLNGNNITQLTVDWSTTIDDMQFRDIQNGTLDTDGILALFNICCTQKGIEKPKIKKCVKTLQIYSATQLKEILTSNGFRVLEQKGIDGYRFNEELTDRILTVAQKL